MIRPSQRRPLTILWVGSVSLGKGIQYLIEAAKLLGGANVRFVVAGPISVSSLALSQAPASMTFLGRVNRHDVAALYRKADVFVLPTLSDGFAITQLEALWHGLPVITTPNCGRVVVDGLSGFVVPPRDPVAVAACITKLDDDRDLLDAMKARAHSVAEEYSLDRFVSGVLTSFGSDTSVARRWIVSQMGAREHYATAVGLHRRRLLHTLFTDAWTGDYAPVFRRFRGAVGALGGRTRVELTDGGARVVAFTSATLFLEAKARLWPSKTIEQAYRAHVRRGQWFGQRVARSLHYIRGEPVAVFAYATGALEVLQKARDQGWPCLLCQFDAAREHERIVLDEVERWAGWQESPGRIPSEFWERADHEWRLADRILVHSEWSRSALVQQGVPASKLVVVPLAFEP